MNYSFEIIFSNKKLNKKHETHTDIVNIIIITSTRSDGLCRLHVRVGSLSKAQLDTTG